MMANKEMASGRPHVLAIPFPLQGHINPMLQFSKLLALRGIKVTLLTTASISKSMHQKPVSIAIESVPDFCGEIESSDEIDAFIKCYQASISRSLPTLVGKMGNYSGCPVKVIAFDAMMPWVLEEAHQLGIKGAALSTQSAAVAAVFYQCQQGTLKLPPPQLLEGTALSSLPSLPPLELRDLPSFVYDPNSYPTLLQLVLSQNLSLGKADWFFFNTFDELENEIVKWMAHQRAVKAIGPMIPARYLQKKLEDDKDYGLSLFTPADENACIKWLDSKQPGSVVYVSFGSLAHLEEEQMREIAYGLVSSKCSFLWVVRASEQSKLPGVFLFERRDNALIVNWCSQLEVLAHRAVGCFLTHCGWNSTLEALSLGVPMVAVPIWADQTTNAKFISDVWQVGVRVTTAEDGFVSRGEVQACVEKVLLQGEERIRLKANCLKWKKLANEAILSGGSSEKNIEEFVSGLNALN